MIGKRVVWPRASSVELEEFGLREPASGELLVETECTLVSPGTERAFLLALPNTPQEFPAHPGYSNIGRVVAVGSGVEGIEVGARVASQAGHQSHAVLAASEVIRVPEGSLVSEEAVFFNLAAIALQAIRKSSLEIGEPVLVLGLGLVGLLATELARLAGAFPLVASDTVESRRRLSERVGADRSLDPESPDFAREVALLGRGRGPAVVIEATGSARAVPLALRSAGWRGRVVLLASTRGSVDGIDFYTDIHKKGVSVIGAHNFVRPREDSTPGFWTARDDWRLALDLMACGRLTTAPLISHRLSWERSPELYRRLMEWDFAVLGAVIRWSARNEEAGEGETS